MYWIFITSILSKAKTDLSWKDKVVIDFVRDDGNLVPLSNIKDLLEVINAEDTAAGIGGIVDNDCRSLVIDEGLHVAQVHLPVLVRQEVVLPRLNTCNLADG
jgi:hypothetical protein